MSNCQLLPQACRPRRADVEALWTDLAAGGLTRTHISARTRRGLVLIPLEEVRYLQADQKYVTVRAPGVEVLIEDTLAALEGEFGPRCRIHRNALVSVAHLQGLQRTPQGFYEAVLADTTNPSRFAAPGGRPTSISKGALSPGPRPGESTMAQRPIRIATRASKLALWQAYWVRDALLARDPTLISRWK